MRRFARRTSSVRSRRLASRRRLAADPLGPLTEEYDSVAKKCVQWLEGLQEMLEAATVTVTDVLEQEQRGEDGVATWISEGEGLAVSDLAEELEGALSIVKRKLGPLEKRMNQISTQMARVENERF